MSHLPRIPWREDMILDENGHKYSSSTFLGQQGQLLSLLLQTYWIILTKREAALQWLIWKNLGIELKQIAQCSSASEGEEDSTPDVFLQALPQDGENTQLLECWVIVEPASGAWLFLLGLTWRSSHPEVCKL